MGLLGSREMQISRAVLMKGFGLTVVVILAGCAGMFWLSDKNVAIDKNCRPDGFISAVRAQIQGERFWTDQVKNIDLRLKSSEKQAQLIASINTKLEAALRDSDATLEKLYSKNPALRPSVAQQTAESLREQAGQIESAESDKYLAEVSDKYARSLRACRAQISESLLP